MIYPPLAENKKIMQGFKTQFAQFPNMQNNQVSPPPPTPPPPTPPPSYAPPPERKDFTVVKVIVISLLITILILGGAVAGVLATRVWDPLWNPFRPKPAVVLSQMLSKMGELKKASYVSKLELIANDTKSSGNGKISLSVDGNYDISGNIKQSAKFTLNANVSGLTQGQADAGTASWENVIDGKDVYVKLTSLEVNAPSTPFSIEEIEKYGVKLDEVKNKWYKTTEENSGDILAKVKETALDPSLWSFKKEMPDESVAGTKAYHYVMVLNTQKLAEKATSSMGDNMPSAMAAGAMNSAFEKIGEITADVWIGKADYYVYKYKISKNFDLSKFSEDVSGNAIINFDLELSKFNLPIVFSMPTDAQDLNSVLGPIEEKMKEEENNQKVENDLLGIATAALDLSSFSKLSCTDPSISFYCDDIKEITGKDLIIKKTGSAYCAYVNSFCIDSVINKSKDNLSVGTAGDPSAKGFCTGYTLVCPPLTE